MTEWLSSEDLGNSVIPLPKISILCIYLLLPNQYYYRFNPKETIIAKLKFNSKTLLSNELHPPSPWQPEWVQNTIQKWDKHTLTQCKQILKLCSAPNFYWLPKNLKYWNIFNFSKGWRTNTKTKKKSEISDLGGEGGGPAGWKFLTFFLKKFKNYKMIQIV